MIVWLLFTTLQPHPTLILFAAWLNYIESQWCDGTQQNQYAMQFKLAIIIIIMAWRLHIELHIRQTASKGQNIYQLWQICVLPANQCGLCNNVTYKDTLTIPIEKTNKLLVMLCSHPTARPGIDAIHDNLKNFVIVFWGELNFRIRLSFKGKVCNEVRLMLGEGIL